VSYDLPKGWVLGTLNSNDAWAHQHRDDAKVWVHMWGSQCDRANGPGVVYVKRAAPVAVAIVMPDPGQPAKSPSWFTCWRFGVWDDRLREAQAALQAAIDANGEGDMWWERQATIAAGKRALWKHRMENPR
jgi:hypothetical protein